MLRYGKPLGTHEIFFRFAHEFIRPINLRIQKTISLDTIRSLGKLHALRIILGIHLKNEIAPRFR